MDESKQYFAFLCGVLEGEACFDIRPSPARKRDPQNMDCRIVVEMKDIDIICKLQATFGGTVREVKCPSKRKENWAIYYQWTLKERYQVLAACKAMYKFMSNRRQQRINELITFLEKKLENSSNAG